jgi:hypothetical protein
VLLQYLYVMDGVMARVGGRGASRMVHTGCGGVAMRLDFDAAWLALREPGWVRVGVVCARSGLAWPLVRYGAEYYMRTASLPAFLRSGLGSSLFLCW